MTAPSKQDEADINGQLSKTFRKVILHDKNCVTPSPTGCSCGALLARLELKNAFNSLILADRQATRTALIAELRKEVASEIFNLAHKYAQDDPTMRGAEKLRDYHYYNAIHKIGEFDGR